MKNKLLPIGVSGKFDNVKLKQHNYGMVVYEFQIEVLQSDVKSKTQPIHIFKKPSNLQYQFPLMHLNTNCNRSK